MAVIARKADDQRRRRLGQPVAVKRVFRHQHAGNAGDLRSLRGRRLRLRPGAEHRHIAKRLQRPDRLGGRVAVQLAIRDFSKQQNSHQITPASFNLPTSSSTEPTLMPALRPSGSRTETTSSRGETSTP